MTRTNSINETISAYDQGEDLPRMGELTSGAQAVIAASDEYTAPIFRERPGGCDSAPSNAVPLRTLLTGEWFRLSPGGRVLTRNKTGGSTLPDGCNGHWIPLDLNTLVYRAATGETS